MFSQNECCKQPLFILDIRGFYVCICVQRVTFSCNEKKIREKITSFHVTPKWIRISFMKSVEVAHHIIRTYKLYNNAPLCPFCTLNSFHVFFFFFIEKLCLCCRSFRLVHRRMLTLHCMWLFLIIEFFCETYAAYFFSYMLHSGISKFTYNQTRKKNRWTFETRIKNRVKYLNMKQLTLSGNALISHSVLIKQL